MKKPKIKFENLTCAYLHSDGHLVVSYSKPIEIDGKMLYQEYIHVYEEYCHPKKCLFKGRIVIHRYQAGMLKAMDECAVIGAKPMTIEHGSDRTKKMNIRVGYLQLDYPDGTNLSWNLMDCISNPITYQPDDRATFTENVCTGSWGTAPITKIFRKEEA